MLKKVGGSVLVDKFKTALLVLLIVSLAFGVVVTYCYVKAKEYEYGACGYGFVAEEIDKPDEYWVLTDPDKWVLEAIENPSKGVLCIGEDMTKQTFTRQAAEHGGIHNVEYQGKYYHISVLFVDTVPPEILEHPAKQVVTYASAGSVALAVLWIVLGVVWYKTKPQEELERADERV